MGEGGWGCGTHIHTHAKVGCLSDNPVIVNTFSIECFSLQNKIQLNRKMLSELAIHEPRTFKVS